MDDALSWIITTEVNRFVWPGFDLRPIARDKPATFHWGYLPQQVFAAVRASVVQHQRAGRGRVVPRD